MADLMDPRAYAEQQQSISRTNRMAAAIIILACLGLAISWPRAKPKVEPLPQPTPAPMEMVDTLDQAVALIKAGDLQAHISELSSPPMDGRGSGTPGCDRARAYIEQKLESWGYKTVRDAFGVRRGSGTAENVYAVHEGSNPNEIVVIGAHYDHLGSRDGRIYPGADDNASGTAAVLEIAHAFARFKLRPVRTIVFQFYAGEEQGLVGSRHYCRNPKFPAKSPSMKAHAYMVNLDMIGRSGGANDPGEPGGAGTPVGMIGGTGPKADVVAAAQPSPQQMARTSAGGSDHASFQEAGVPTKFFHTGLHSDYHKTTDTVDKVNVPGVEAIAQKAMRLAWDKSCATVREPAPVFSASPTLMDHGDQPFEQQ